jgi:hypothetical protein
MNIDKMREILLRRAAGESEALRTAVAALPAEELVDGLCPEDKEKLRRLTTGLADET